MQAHRFFIVSATCLTLAACGQSGEPPKAAATGKPAAQAPAPAASGAPTAEAKKEEKHDTPDTHGMPGMSELFKDDPKK
jgi:hypothetical protein